MRTMHAREFAERGEQLLAAWIVDIILMPAKLALAVAMVVSNRGSPRWRGCVCRKLPERSRHGCATAASARRGQSAVRISARDKLRSFIEQGGLAGEIDRGDTCAEKNFSWADMLYEIMATASLEAITRSSCWFALRMPISKVVILGVIELMTDDIIKLRKPKIYRALAELGQLVDGVRADELNELVRQTVTTFGVFQDIVYGCLLLPSLTTEQANAATSIMPSVLREGVFDSMPLVNIRGDKENIDRALAATFIGRLLAMKIRNKTLTELEEPEFVNNISADCLRTGRIQTASWFTNWKHARNRFAFELMRDSPGTVLPPRLRKTSFFEVLRLAKSSGLLEGAIREISRSKAGVVDLTSYDPVTAVLAAMMTGRIGERPPCWVEAMAGSSSGSVQFPKLTVSQAERLGIVESARKGWISGIPGTELVRLGTNAHLKSAEGKTGRTCAVGRWPLGPERTVIAGLSP